MYSIGKTWPESRKQCQVDGGDLVIIRSEKEAAALQEIYANHDTEYIVNHPTHMWAGLLENSPNTWETVEGKKIIGIFIIIVMNMQIILSIFPSTHQANDWYYR